MSAGFLSEFLIRAEREPASTLFTIWEAGEPRDLTHGALKDGGLAFARHFRATGIEPGHVILIALPLGPDLIQAFLGALMAGSIPSLMPSPSPKQDPELFWSSHDQLFGRLGGGVIVTTEDNARDLRTRIKSARMSVVTPVEVARDPGGAAGDAIHSWNRDDLACLQHSSGTTGLKKGVMLSFAKIEAQLSAYANALRLSPQDDRIVSWLPLYHDMGFIACFLMPLATGTRAIILDPFAWLPDPLALFDLVERYRGTLMWLPNFAFNHLANAADDLDPSADLSSLRLVIDCSEPCRSGSLDVFAARFAPWGLDPASLATCYAMAETVFAVTQTPPGESPKRVRVERSSLDTGAIVVADGPGPEVIELVSSGHALDGVEIVVLDDSLKPVPPRMTGQVAIKAPYLFDGYYLEPERSARAFKDGFYLTGDLGFAEEGDLYVLGRKDDLIIVLGRNLFANEAENILGALPGLKPGRILALGVADEATGSQDLVIIAEVDGLDQDETAIRLEIRRRLDSILGLSPRKIIFVAPGWLIKSTAGKISRSANRQKYLTNYAEPKRRGEGSGND